MSVKLGRCHVILPPMNAIKLQFLEKYRDLGLLLMRAGLGVSFMFHGWPKLAGGAQLWQQVGAAMSTFGIDFGHTAFGLAAALSELVGGLLLVVGFMTRPALVALIFTMIVATAMHIANDHDYTKISHPLEVGFAFIGLLCVGPGRFSIDKK